MDTAPNPEQADATAPRTPPLLAWEGRSTTVPDEAAANSVVVEFCGLPGAGKTTLADLTQVALTARGVRSRVVDSNISAAATALTRYVARMSNAAEQTAFHPLSSARAAHWVTGSRQPSTRDRGALLIQWLATARLSSHARRSAGVWLMQEGLAQTLYTMLLRGDCDTSTNLVHTLPTGSRADLVVIVEVPVEEALYRLANRSSRHSRTQHLSGALQRAELGKGQDVLRQVVDRLDVPTLRLTNDQRASPAQLAAAILAEVVPVQC